MSDQFYDVEGIEVEAPTPAKALMRVLNIDELPEPGEIWHNENMYTDLPDLIVDRVLDNATRTEIILRSAGCLEISLRAVKVSF